MKWGKKKLPKVWWFIVLMTGLILVYLFGLFYYRTHFLANTMIGSTNVAGQTVDSAIEKINEDLNNYEIALTESGESLGFIELGQLGSEIAEASVLNETMAQQNRYTWPIAMFNQKGVRSDNLIEMDDELVAGLMEALSIQNDDREPSTDAFLQEQDNQLIVVPETYGNQMNISSLKGALSQQFLSDEHVLALEDAYIQPEVKEGSNEIQAQMDYLNEMKQTNITMMFDNNEVTIPQEVIASWVSLDAQGQPIIDIESIEDYILEVNREYAQLFQPHQFHSTYQGTVTVQPGTLGWYINRFTEAEHIASLIYETGEYRYEPHIEGYGYGLNGAIGNSYVEVDLTHQMMLIYIDGELVLDTPIVSGKIGANTIPGAYQVWQKLENTDLTGYDPTRNRDYVQPVDYWIAFDDQLQGIHDANWQSYFGGDAYLMGGSLGCINTPPSVMGTVYELVEVGMPVLVIE